MTPLKLTLKNFTGIKAGMGRDVLELDLTGAGAGSLVLLKGDNGRGKTTVLDNLHPYRLMPSRSSSYSPGGFSYYDHTTGDAEKVLEWEHNGARYLSHIIIKGAGKAKKTEAYLTQWRPLIDGGAWSPVFGPAGVTSDGKTATYDACLEHVLGTAEMFFTSAFSCQGRRQLSDYKNSDIKDLMAELLALDHVTDIGERANEVVRLLAGREQLAADAVGRYGDVEAQQTSLQGAAKINGSQLAGAEQTVAACRRNLETGQQELRTAERLAADEAGTIAERDRLERERTQLQESAAQRTDDLQSQLDQLSGEIGQVNTTYNNREKELQGRITTLQGRMADLQTLLSRREEIATAANQVPVLEQQLAEAEAAGTAAKADDNKLRETISAGAEAGKAATKALSERDGTSRRLQDLMRTSALVDNVPCAGTDLQGRCQLLQSAVDARIQVPVVQQELADRDAAVVAATRTMDEITAEQSRYADAPERLEAARKQYRDISELLQRARNVAGQADRLADAEGQLVVLRTDLTEVEDGIDGARRERETALAQLTERQSGITTSMSAVKVGCERHVADIEAKLAALPAGDGQAAIDRARVKVFGAQNSLTHADEQLQTLRDAGTRYRTQLEACEQQLAGKAADAAKLSLIRSELTHWRTLAKALGRDGVVALCIDDAGPTLAGLTNELLLSCYGPRFTVSVETQAETAAGTVRETFDVRVFDADSGDDKSIRDMSGGERVWINECLTRAIALYQAQQSGQTYGTLFADESDGALDPSRKVMFMTMKRKVLELGGYQQEIFITHTPELHDLADRVIDLDAMREVA